MKKVLVIATIILCIMSVILGVWYFKFKDSDNMFSNAINSIFNKESKNSNNDNSNNDENKKTEVVIRPGDYVPSKMIEVTSNQRDISVVVENSPDARPQSSLSKAYIVYEFVVEAGITRYLAVFNSSDADKIGPVRSARHHFFDYVLENDATFVHFGGSSKAYADIPLRNIEDLDGLIYDGIYFKRDKSRYAPHNAYTSMDYINKYMNKNYRVTSDKENIFKYSSNEVVLDESDDATIVEIEYANDIVKYEYDNINKVYNRYISNKKDIDKETNKQITVKNVIVQNVKYWTLTGKYANKGVQDMKSIGKGTGYYFTEGKMIEIKWEKDDSRSKTKYLTLDDKEIILNDGNTYVQMQPENFDVTNLTPKKEIIDETVNEVKMDKVE